MLKKWDEKEEKNHGEVRREKATFKKQVLQLLSLPLQDEKKKNELLELGFEKEELNNQLALVTAVYKKAEQRRYSLYQIYS